MSDKFPPRSLASLLGTARTIDFSKLPSSDPRYRNLKAYTLHFAEHQGGKALLETAKKLFADHDPYAALAAVSKA
ncbi:hypothetical protein JG688_00015487 [Phytophthora aleatoria]|uniref:Uncharacterized protein n=1 Tax=Phytophthora aleatoria TaxID=2496075 RepID=A0A8J5LWT8_9STRA|nr:hypothetical protein JG688_00015487 [Phytophthora aleatoria]